MPKVKSGPYHPVGEELKRQVLLNGTLRSVAPALGLDEGQAYNRFSKPDNVRLAFVLSLPAKIRVSLWAILRKGVKDSEEDALSVLLSQREDPELPPCSFLDPLAPRLTALFSTKVARNLSAPSQQPIIETLEEQRYTDRAAARGAVEKLIIEVVGALEEFEGAKPRKLLGELAAALALWASIQRGRGYRDLAVKGFTFAFPLAVQSKDFWARGSCFQRAAYLLGDLSRNDLGLDFIRDAIVYFSTEGSSSLLAKCQVDRGHFLLNCGRYSESSEAFERGLDLLTGSDWRNRVSALQGLGMNARAQGHLEKARKFLVLAASECARIDLVAGHVNWTRANIEADLGNLAAAREYHEEATKILGQFGSAGDVALVCVDYADVLWRQRDTKRAETLATEVASWLPSLGGNKILCRAFGKFLDLIRATRMESMKLPEIRESFKDAWKLGEEA